jgi:hypothetical protein
MRAAEEPSIKPILLYASPKIRVNPRQLFLWSAHVSAKNIFQKRLTK